MEDNKYYTPSIEEFYVGFEYEEYISQVVSPRDIIIVEGEIYTGPEKLESEWVKSILTDYYYDLEDIADIFNSKKEVDKLRVKYLDREDIESLGFIKESSWDWEFRYKENKKLPGYSYEDYIGLEYHPDTKLMYIGTSGMTVFNGIIKNLSELKKLLIQIGVQ